MDLGWGSPIGLGFMMISLGVFFWGLSKLARINDDDDDDDEG